MKPFEMTLAMRIGTDMLIWMLRVGFPMGTLRLLAHQGRKSGKTYKTPVALVEKEGKRWLVAAFGETNWVHNIRAVGEAQLIVGRKTETVRVTEIESAQAAPILKQFLKSYGIVPFIPPYFAVSAQAPVSAFEDEAKDHPVFLLEYMG